MNRLSASDLRVKGRGEDGLARRRVMAEPVQTASVTIDRTSARSVSPPSRNASRWAHEAARH